MNEDYTGYHKIEDFPNTEEDIEKRLLEDHIAKLKQNSGNKRQKTSAKAVRMIENKFNIGLNIGGV